MSYCAIFILAMIMWDKKCLRDEMKWAEWLWHCDVVLDYNQPSDTMSELSALGPQLTVGNCNDRKQNCGKGETAVFYLWFSLR